MFITCIIPINYDSAFAVKVFGSPSGSNGLSWIELLYNAQVDAYDDRKRKYTRVYADVTDRKRYNHDRLRAVKQPFCRDRITFVSGRVTDVFKPKRS